MKFFQTLGEDSEGNELDVNYDVVEFISGEKGLDCNFEDHVVKKLSIGVSVQNAKDKFDEDLGITDRYWQG